MELINSTRMIAGYTLGLDPSGREFLIVAIKGTFQIPVEQGALLRLHQEQVPLFMSDVYFGEPGKSAPKYEVDFALRKPRCDVLLNASAYAPGGRPTRRVEVSAQIGSWAKSFAVVGDRHWEANGLGIGISSPAPFVRKPITYDYAFGGTNIKDKDSGKHVAFMKNPSGRGFHKQLVPEWMHGTSLPNTEEIKVPVTWASEDYNPMSFGPIGRHWQSRVPFAGTYDKQWLDEQFPFLPADFDDRYYQAAPTDQQLHIPVGAQMVQLTNLTPGGSSAFTLPFLEAPVHVFPKKGNREDFTAQMDTIVIEPDDQRVMITWRVARPLNKNLFELAQVLVGKKGNNWWQERGIVPFPIPIVVESMKKQEIA